MNYPAPLSQFLEPGVQVFATREQAAAAYQALHGKPLPAYDAARPVQLFMETRPAPSGELSAEAGYQYNFLGQDSQGYYRMDAPEGLPYSLACVPNIPEAGLPGAGINQQQMYLFPLRKLGSVAATGGLEVIASSPFGVEVVDSSQPLSSDGLVSPPPDIVAQIAAGTYVPPGV